MWKYFYEKFDSLWDPTDWLSELLELSRAIKVKLDEIRLAINPELK